jgi:hypothetical protein
MSTPGFGTYGWAISSPSSRSSGPSAASRSGVATRCTARPELPFAGLTTSGYSDSGISARSSGVAAAYVGGIGSPRPRPIAAASALSRTPRMARASLTVARPAEAAASSRVSPGPPETVLSTHASWLPALTRSVIRSSDPPGRSTSTWWPHARSCRITSTGMPS